jgi:hypothetical protein
MLLVLVIVKTGFAMMATVVLATTGSQGLYPPTETDAGLNTAECTGKNLG